LKTKKKGFKLEPFKKKYEETPFQTAGPYLHIGFMPNYLGINGIYKNDIGIMPFPKKMNEELITITGSVFDGNEEALDDVFLETWQSDTNGKYFESHGFARFIPNKITKKYSLITIKPGSVENFDGIKQSPHILLSISSRGLNMSLNTRIYFEDDNLTSDPLLSTVKNVRNDVSSLIAKKIGNNTYSFDIFLQGDKETIFLDI
jgi:protocatechuate 3,4-dioxygenase alpha subunit